MIKIINESKWNTKNIQIIQNKAGKGDKGMKREAQTENVNKWQTKIQAYQYFL